MELRPDELALLPSPAEVAFYQAHGWYISKPVVPASLLDEARFGADRYYDGERDALLPPVSSHFDWSPDKGEMLRLNAYVSLQNAQLRKLVQLPIIAAIAAVLAGTHTIRLFRDQLILKPPEDRGHHTHVGWHVDRAYWLTCTSEQMLTAWLPFHDCNAEMGTLVMIDGSHRWQDNLDLRTFHEQDLGALLEQINTTGQPIVEVPMNLTKGQVSFHHCRTIHGSYANRSDQPRISLAMHLQDATNRYQMHYGASGRPTVHLNDLLCRKLPSGEPDYTDPHICPILWNSAA